MRVMGRALRARHLRALSFVAFGTTEVERLALRRCRVEFQTGMSEEGVDQLGSVLDPFEAVLHHRDQLIDTVHDEVAQAALDMRPHMLSWIEVRGVGWQSDHV